MKLLLLSTCGLSNEKEDLRYINLYLASLKKHVVPYFDTKVILYNNSNVEKSEHSKTLQRVKEFGLEQVVEVKNVHEVNLPEKAIQFLQSQHWAAKIGLNMNMLFDYAKQHNFFDADWIFHTDTDIEFLSNFKDNLEKVHGIVDINKQVVISLAGDAYPYHMLYNDKEYLFDEPIRIDIYNDEHLNQQYNFRQLKYIDRSGNEIAEEKQNKLVFQLQQQKVRNDFFGISRAAAMITLFNWTTCHYPNDFRPTVNQNGEINEGAEELYRLWNECKGEKFDMLVNHDKGSIVQYQLQKGHYDIIKVQLRGYTDMAKHFGSGYFATNRSWIEESHQTLEKDYQDTKNIWEIDYIAQKTTKIDENLKSHIELKISELEQQIQELKTLINK